MEPIMFLSVPSTQDLLADMMFWQTKAAEKTGVPRALLGRPLWTGIDWGQELWIADNLTRQAREAELRIRAMVAENLQVQMRREASSLPTPATLQTAQLPTTATEAPTAEQILQQMRELMAATEPWEDYPVIPIDKTELAQLETLIPMVPADLTRPKGLAPLTAMGCSLHLVKPDSPMTAAELRQWMLARRQLETMKAPSTSAT